MAISANAVWEIRTTATTTNANGGFFVTGASGTDYSQQDSRQYQITGGSSAGAGNTILTASASADMVGNGAYVVSGTNVISTVAGGLNRFEITSVSVGVSITFSTNVAGSSIATGIASNVVINIGGAAYLGNADEDALFEAASPGHIYYLKSGSHSNAGNISLAANGTGLLPIRVIGYNTTRGDAPTGTSRPNWAVGAMALGNYWSFEHLSLTGTNTSVLNPATGCRVINCKLKNSSTSAGRAAILASGNNIFIHRCEMICYRGYGLSSNGAAVVALNNYIHDCDAGINNFAAGNDSQYVANLIESCVTAAIQFTNSATELNVVCNNTLYGSENTTGIGLSLAAGVTNVDFINNIVYGFATGVSHGATNKCHDNFNLYYNNDTDVTNWTKGGSDVATNPNFGSVSQVTVTTATTSNTGNTLTKTGATFITSGVTAGRDYVYISASGTGTVGIYGISSVDSETQLTLDLAPGNSTADVSAQITVGRNFSPRSTGGAVAAGFPGAYGSSTTGYQDIGAVQSQFGTGSSGGSTVPTHEV